MLIIQAAGVGLVTVIALAPAACPDVRPASALPSPLHGEALAWDGARGRLVLFGGREPGGWLAGTWEWDGRGWRQAVDGSASPRARSLGDFWSLQDDVWTRFGTGER